MEQIGQSSPLAIVGLGTRLPGGANSPVQFWNLLKKGYDAIETIPKERWDAEYFHDPDNLGLVGKSNQNQGGFMKGWNPEEVDLKFFHFSPREAKLLDPNQRLLLELTYETFEDAGLTLNDMSGSRTGVFIGISATDYSYWQFPEINTMDSHTQTGVSTSIVANRLSYFYNLLGPSFIVDTACSSTLVALNCAAQSIRNGECRQALVGAVNVLLLPEISIGFSKLGVLSPDGHCKAFDAAANGYVRSEGAGLLLIKPLVDAEKDNNRIFAVIRGTACCSDGKMNSQMTSPSEEQQEWLYTQILNLSNIYPSEVHYVETHGTGTAVGDPIECRSISKVIGIGRDKNTPVLIGSNKSNLGHLEPAAGVVSLIKMALALKHNLLPPTISVKNVNPKINEKEMNIKFCTKLQPFPKPVYPNQPRTALVSAFGFGGTNSSAVLQEYQGKQGLKDCPNCEKELSRSELLVLSAKSAESLKESAKQLAKYLKSKTSAPLTHVAYTLACHRTHHSQFRFACIVKDKQEAIEKLEAYAADKLTFGSSANHYQAASSEKKRNIVLLYSGQGPQWYGMGRSLFQTNEVFRQSIVEFDEIYKEFEPEVSVIREMFREKEDSNVSLTKFLQPHYVAIQMGLSEVMMAAGLPISTIVAHSLGETGASYVCGALSKREAIKVVYERCRAQYELTGNGFMGTVKLPREKLNIMLKQYPTVALAGHNSPSFCNVSGDTEEMLRLIADLQASDVFAKKLPIDEAMHSHQVDLKKDQIISNLSDLVPCLPTTPIISTHIPHSTSPIVYNGEYFYSSLRHTVEFHDAIVECIRRHEHQQENQEIIFLELDPHPVLRQFVNEISNEVKKPQQFVPTLIREDFQEREALFRALAQIYTYGFTPDFKQSVFQPLKQHDLEDLYKPIEDVKEYYFVPDLPLYSWSRTHCWNESIQHTQHRLGTGHPLVRVQLDSFNPSFESDVSTSYLPWVEHHLLQGNIVVPGVTYVECMLTCGKKLFGENAKFWFKDVHFRNAFYMNRGEVYRVNISFSPIHKPGSRFEKPTQYSAALSSRVLPNGEWDLHCTGVLELEEVMEEREKQLVMSTPGINPNFVPTPPGIGLEDFNLEEFRKLCPYEQPLEKFFADLWQDGLELHRELRLTRKVWVNDLTNPIVSVGYIEVNPEMTTEQLSKWTNMYPPMMDSCLQSGLSGREYRGAFFPVEAKRARFVRPFDPTKRHAWSCSRKDPITGLLSMTCCDDEGKIYGSLQDVRIHYLEKSQKNANGAKGGEETPCYENGWTFLNSVDVPANDTNAHVADIETIETDMKNRIVEMTEEMQLAQKMPEIDRWNNKLTIAVILNLFRNHLNFFKGQSASASFVPLLDITKAGDVQEFYHRLIVVFCKDLEREGYVELKALSGSALDTIEQISIKPTAKYFLKKSASGADELPDDENATFISANLLTISPHLRPSTVLMMEVAMNMHQIIQSSTAVDPISLIFKDGVTADAVYRDDIQVRPYNFLCQAALAELIKSKPKDQPLNILEIGAGTGGTTAYLLELLDRHTSKYTFTDVGRSFLPLAQKKFAEYKSSMEFRHLDIENDPIEQGIAPESQDIIVAANVLHATEDLSVTLGNTLKMLKPGGTLILLEALHDFYWLDTVFGLTKGWWRVKDLDFRRHPLLTPPLWEKGLTSVGFGSVKVYNQWEDKKGSKYEGRLCVTLAQKPFTKEQAKQDTTIKTATTPATAVVLVGEKETVGGKLVASLLREGFHVVAGSRTKKLDLKTLVGSELNDSQIATVSKFFHSDIVEKAESSRDGYDAIWTYCESQNLPAVMSIVNLWSLDLPVTCSSEADVMEDFKLNCYCTLYLTHSLIEWTQKPIISQFLNTYAVTQACWAVEQTLEKDSVGLGQAVIWGMNRCILNECTAIRPHTVDLSYAPSDVEINALIRILTTVADESRQKAEQFKKDPANPTIDYVPPIASNESEIALRGEKVFGSRLFERSRANEMGMWSRNRSSTEQNYALVSNSLKSVVLQERQPLTLCDDCVEVSVAAAGLNIHDLLLWNETSLTERLKNPTLGLEFSGVVKSVGKNVSQFKVGDRVFGVGKETIASFITVPASQIRLVPDRFALDEIVSVPIALSTAYEALVRIARLRKGKFVLIHNAADAIGLAAIQIAKAVGAIPICTEDQEFKRSYLKISGIEHVLDCSSTEFTDHVLAITNNNGVNVVLNTLSGINNIHAGMKCLARNGHFIELVEQDLETEESIRLETFTQRVSFTPLSVPDMIAENDGAGELFNEAFEWFEKKNLTIPLSRAFPLTQAQDAFEYFNGDTHIGKVVLSPIAHAFSKHAVPQNRKVVDFNSQGSYIDPEGSYLITGGTAGFSLDLAKGVGDEARQKTFEDLRQQYSAEIVVKAVDISNATATRALLAEIRSTMKPLRGVIHGAMVLADGLLHNLTAEKFWTVLAPKAFGAWVIHEDTMKHNDPIDMFILMSSLNVVVGTHGQANYGSANIFLDSLALHRRSLGLNALSVQWGVLAETGYVHRTSSTSDNMHSFGFRSLTPRWANRILHTSLESLNDFNCERNNTLPPSGALTSSYADTIVSTYSKLPKALTPVSLLPDYEIAHKTHFFDGSKHINNIIKAHDIFSFPECVPVTVGIFKVEWEPLFAFMHGLTLVGRFEEIRKIVAENSTQAAAGATSDSGKQEQDQSADKSAVTNAPLDQQLRQISDQAKAIELIAHGVAGQAAKVLGLGSADQIQIDVPLSQYGLDSLTAVEMKNWTEKFVKVDVPVVDFVRGPSSENLAKNMLEKFYDKFGKPKETDEAPAPQTDSVQASSTEQTTQKEEKVEEVKVVKKRVTPKTAFVFTGQSGLKQGVGMDLYATYPEAKKIWDECDAYFMEKLNISILHIVRENPKELVIDFSNGEEGKKLRQKYMDFVITEDESVMASLKDDGISARAFPTITENTPRYVFTSPNGLLSMTQFAQPIIVIYEFVALSCLKFDNPENDLTSQAMFCGHSLGEYCALVSLGKITPAAQMSFMCFIRGLVMQTCVPRDPVTHMSAYGMAAVSPTRVAPWFKIEHLKKVLTIVVNACGGRLLEIVNYNVFNDQYVVSGERFCIWQLGMALKHIEEHGEEGMTTVGSFCYNSVGVNPRSATPLEVPRTKSVLPLAGIDVPFHSSLLRKVVPMFRSFLEGYLPSTDQFDYVTRLEDRFVTNLYSKEVFSVTREFATAVANQCGSPFLLTALRTAEGPESWDEMTRAQRGRLLLRECLSFQFASAVQWIDAQNTLIKSGVRRVVEIGPAKTLAGMMSKSLLRLKNQEKDVAEMAEIIADYPSTGTGRAGTVEVLSFDGDRETLFRIADEEIPFDEDNEEDDF
ncbi:putative Phenolphthiocerol/phthiocerol polyketide synthase subunit C [Blattamonas nauphoetae]|uniref:Phenolphthiocerol/phthiocerol polyketide synthase subunit C n=1 Tax=Blattamonas nauphoetae TaxID=2049346 RepID=A0ABQ9YCT2_9EUKA|nr:putative Phenolphthiocerol/phthiocerol polyketide synthase subunit C [Blattamonas nauphoetae]